MTQLFRYALAATALFFVPRPLDASPINLITNGGFETTTNGPGEIVPGKTTGTYITSATGWYSTSTAGNGGDPFLFIAAANTADSTGFPDAWDNGYRHIWGPNDGSSNGFTGVSPDGGNMLIMDADYHATPISQDLSGLHVGTVYSVSFWWAAAQWSLNTGATTESVQVSLAGNTQSTSTFNLPSKGFSGWMKQTFTFLYTGGISTLSFFAVGGPSGEPPLVLLDGVTLIDAPEPAAWTSFATACVGLAALQRRRRTLASRPLPH